MTNRDILAWIKHNLGPVIQPGIVSARVKHPNHPYTEDWLAAITCRETGELIARYAPHNPPLASIAAAMRGDYTKRPGETEDQYHGFGFQQVDIASFPAFVKSGDWKDPGKCLAMAIDILESKRVYLQAHFAALLADPLARAITAAYNCGEGNVRDVLNEKHDIDIRTTGKNYSAQVWEFRQIYSQLP